jgi:membrane protease YdiL (CAAX protease family)
VRWLKKELRGFDVVWMAFVYGAGALVYSMMAFPVVMVFWGRPAASNVKPIEQDLAEIWLLPAAALTEEILFRLPLALIFWRRYRLESMLAAALVLSLLFGYAHGGWYHVIFQGVSGFAFSLVFIKCGGYRYHYGKALLASGLSHTITNTLVALILLVMRLTVSITNGRGG